MVETLMLIFFNGLYNFEFTEKNEATKLNLMELWKCQIWQLITKQSCD